MKAARIIALALALVLVAGSAALSTEGSATSVTLTPSEAYMLDAINTARVGANAAPLKLDEDLTNYARSYAQEMRDNNFFGHDSPVSGSFGTRIAKVNIRAGYTIVGENLASTSGSGIDELSGAKQAFDGLMKSEGHRKNILNPAYDRVGIGYASKDLGGGVVVMYWVQEFIKSKWATSETSYSVGPSPTSSVSHGSRIAVKGAKVNKRHKRSKKKERSKKSRRAKGKRRR